MDKVVKKIIRKNIHEEKEAITDYRKAAKKARKLGDKKTANLFTHISKDEIHHRKELKKRLPK